MERDWIIRVTYSRFFSIFFRNIAMSEFRMTLYKIINVSPIQEHPYQTRYGGAEPKKCLNHCHNIIKSSKRGSFILNNCWKYERNSTKKWSFNNEIKSQERPRMQDLAPFIPELLGALSGPQTSASICLLLFNFLLLLQNLLTSLQTRYFDI
jgi:hypothetical protein